MLRLRFDPTDLGKVRFAVSAVAQTVRSACLGSCPRNDPFLRRWQQRVFTRVPLQVKPLLDVVNADEHYYPDVLTPDTFVPGARWSLDDELDGLVAASENAVVSDFGSLSHRDLGARLIDSLGSSRGGGRQKLVDAVRGYHDSLFGAEWQAIKAHLEADIARRAMLQAVHGTDHVLSTLHPRITWDHPVLTLHGCRPKTYDLAGRGLLLIPAVFGAHSVAWILNDWQQPTLVYPASGLAQLWTGATDAVSASLDALIGRGRAAALRAIGTGCGTGELANRLGVGVATASEHAAALRKSGLTATERTGKSVHHSLTRLGVDLLATEADTVRS